MPDLKLNQKSGLSFLDYTIYQDDLDGVTHTIQTKLFQAYGNRYVVTHSNTIDAEWETMLRSNLNAELPQSHNITVVTDDSITQAVDLVTKYAYPSYNLVVAKLATNTQSIPFRVMDKDIPGKGSFGVLGRALIQCPSAGRSGGLVDICSNKADGTILLHVSIPDSNVSWYGTFRQAGNVGAVNDYKDFYLITGTNNPSAPNIGTLNRPNRSGQKYLQFRVECQITTTNVFIPKLTVQSLEVAKTSGYSSSNEEYIYIDTFAPYIAVKPNEVPIALDITDRPGDAGFQLADEFPLGNPYTLGSIIVKLGYSVAVDPTSTKTYDTEPAFLIEAY